MNQEQLEEVGDGEVKEGRNDDKGHLPEQTGGIKHEDASKEGHGRSVSIEKGEKGKEYG